MAVRRFLIFGEADLAALSALSRPIVAAWADQWLIDGEKEVRVLRTEDASNQEMLPAGVSSGDYVLGFDYEGRQAFCIVNDEFVRMLCDSVLGPDVGGAQRVVRARWREQELALAGDVVGGLSRGLLGQERLLGYADRLVDAHVSKLPQGSGWVKVVIGIGSQSISIWLNQDAVLALRPILVPGAKGESLAARSSALTTGSFRVEALVGEAEVSLLELFELRPGHVVRLDTRFGEPLKVLSKSSGKAIAKAWLGSYGEKKSLQINAE
jgi:flagellar motor switch/type III secretory pathway protein FliN